MSTQEVDFKIVDLILSTGVLPKEARHQSTFHECIHELSSLPISRLASEPSYLRECHKRVVEENYKWAYDNYGTFIQTAECTKQIFQDFENVQTMNQALTEKIPLFLNVGHNFIDQCRQFMNLANMNSLTLQKHNQILEILEIPQLLEACIRNNYLDEALELIAHSRKLERRHPNIGIITSVTQEVRVAAQKLLDQLFQQLGANLQLPSCLKIVGYLRRMDCLPETLLRLKFLECRDNYLMGLLRSLASNDPFFHATKFMEVTRVNLFDIATQYRAVFNDDDMYLASSNCIGQQHHMLFSSWLVMRVDVFITSLSSDINSIIDSSLCYNTSTGHTQSNSQSVGSKLQSLLGQAMYFGLSLSRIGSDFRGLLMPVFYQAVMKYIDMRLLEICDSFADCIGSYKWTVNIDDSVFGSLSHSLQCAEEILSGHKSEEISAPAALMNHPILALLINQMLSVLEDIRLCCPRVLRTRICKSYSDTIQELLKILMKYYEDEGPNFTGKEQKSFIGMISALLCCFLPHMDLCLTMLFSSDRDQTSRIGASIDVAALSEMFSDILPASFFSTTQAEEEANEEESLSEEYEGKIGESMNNNESGMMDSSVYEHNVDGAQRTGQDVARGEAQESEDELIRGASDRLVEGAAIEEVNVRKDKDEYLVGELEVGREMGIERLEFGSEGKEMGIERVELGSEGREMGIERVELGCEGREMGSQEKEVGSDCDEEVVSGADYKGLGKEDKTMENMEEVSMNVVGVSLLTEGNMGEDHSGAGDGLVPVIEGGLCSTEGGGSGGDASESGTRAGEASDSGVRRGEASLDGDRGGQASEGGTGGGEASEGGAKEADGSECSDMGGQAGECGGHCD